MNPNLNSVGSIEFLILQTISLVNFGRIRVKLTMTHNEANQSETHNECPGQVSRGAINCQIRER